MKQLSAYRLVKNALTYQTIARAIIKRLARAEKAGVLMPARVLKRLIHSYNIPELASGKWSHSRELLMPGSSDARLLQSLVRFINEAAHIPRHWRRFMR